MTDTPAPSDRDAASRLLDVAELVDIKATRVGAELHLSPPPKVATVKFTPDIEYSLGPGHFGNRFAYRFDLRSSSGDDIATIEFTLVAAWRVPEDYTPDQEGADIVTGTTGYFAAYPYARELLQSMTMRLGIDTVVIGTIRRDTLSPAGVTIGPTHVERDSPVAASVDEQGANESG